MPCYSQNLKRQEVAAPSQNSQDICGPFPQSYAAMQNFPPRGNSSIARNVLPPTVAVKSKGKKFITTSFAD